MAKYLERFRRANREDNDWKERKC